MKKILLIEDNQDHSELISRSLREGLADVQIQQTTRVKDAVALLKKKNFDLILTDFYLPDSRGEAHIRLLAKMVPEIPIIIITGQGDEKTAARSIKAGADDYIIKTREALHALPRILNRTFAKHQSSLNKKRKEIKRQLDIQDKAMKKILGEVQNLENQISKLKQRKTTPQKSRKSSGGSLEGLVRQVGSLKQFIQKIFLSGD